MFTLKTKGVVHVMTPGDERLYLEHVLLGHRVLSALHSENNTDRGTRKLVIKLRCQ